MTFAQFCGRCANVLAHPVAIVAVPFIAGTAIFFVDVNVVNTILSVVALTFSQVVLQTSIRESKATRLQLEGLIKGVPDADNELIGIEQNEALDKA